MRNSDRYSGGPETPAARGATGRRRAGASMIEVTVAVAIATALLGAASVMIVRLVGIQRNVETAGQQTVVLSRLARQFRSDVHAAGTVILHDEATELVLLPVGDSQRRVTYTAGPQHLTRTVTGTEKDSREEYRFSAGTTSRFHTERLPDAARPDDFLLVRLMINRPWLPVPGAGPLPRKDRVAGADPQQTALTSHVPVPLRIEAVSGGPVLRVGIKFGQTPAAALQAAATEATP